MERPADLSERWMEPPVETELGVSGDYVYLIARLQELQVRKYITKRNI